MTGATYDVELNSLAAQDALNQLLEVFGNLKPTLMDIGEYLMIADRQRFRAQVSPDGTPWAPLSPRYAKTKRKNKDRILFLDGYLQNTRRYQIPSDTELVFGSDRPYAAIMHWGGEINMPARMRTLYFKQTKEGVGNKFVKKNKSDFAQDVQGKAYKVKIPARPNLGTSDADNMEILNIIIHRLDGGTA